MRQVDFNKIYVLESLGDADVKTGSMLYNDMISRKIAQNNVNCGHDFYVVSSKEGFFEVLSTIERETINNLVNPFIHLEIHGNVNGLVLNSGELVSWKELQSSLISLNVLSKNNTFVTLATCFGGYIFQLIDVRQASPFWGYVGPLEAVSQYQIMVGFHEFFDELLTSGDFALAVERLNNEGDSPVPFYFRNAEHLFQQVYEIYERKYLTLDYKKIRTEDGLREIRAKYPSLNMTDDEVRGMFRHILDNYSEMMKSDIEDRFLMYDLYPDLKGSGT